MSAPESRYMTTDDMAEETGKSRDFWARVCHSGELRAVKLGNDWHAERSAFEDFMRGGTQVTARKRLSARQQRRAS